MRESPAPLPALIVVTGRPASGKSTLARALSAAVRCPLVSRDALKEGLIHTAGRADAPGDDTPRRAYDAFFDTVGLLLGRGVSLVAEAAFQHKLWSPRLEPLRESARIRIIVCGVDAATAAARFRDRDAADPDRRRFHHADAGGGGYDPPRIPGAPTLEVDTSDGYSPGFNAIVAFARGEAA